MRKKLKIKARDDIAGDWLKRNPAGKKKGKRKKGNV